MLSNSSVTYANPSTLRIARVALALFGVGLTAAILAATACGPGDPADPKTPIDVPVPTKLERPDDPPGKPKSPDASAATPGTPGQTAADPLARK